MIHHLLALKGCFGYLALAGGIVMYFSRRNIQSVATKSSDYWMRAFRIIPCAEMFYAASHWERTNLRTPTAFWCAGFLCCIPFALVKLDQYEREARFEQSDGDAPSAEQLGVVAGKDLDFAEVLRACQRKERLDELNVLLTGWYREMSSRRATLTGAATAAVETFNVEAAAYAELLKLVKQERSELAVIQSRLGDSFPQSGATSWSD